MTDQTTTPPTSSGSRRPDEVSPEGPPRRIRSAVAGAAIGNFVHWFDFGSYGFLAPVLAVVFFPSDNIALGLMATFAVFGVAFLMNPLGGLIFGPLGDRIGRKKLLAGVIVLMSTSTFLVGVLPGYASIGIAAPILLIVLRLIQGLAGGGEPGGAATFLVEYARRGRRARTVSFWHCSSYLANAAASVLVLALTAGLGAAVMEQWGWRIPFLIAGPLGLIGLFIRLRLDETPEFEHVVEAGEVAESPTREVFRTSWRKILQVVGCIALQAAAFYFTFVYMETYIQATVGLSATVASASTVVCLCVASVTIFVFATISDRFGRRPVMIAGALGCMIAAYPALIIVNSGGLAGVFVGHAVLGVCVATFMSGSGAALVELFPTRVRLGGFSIGFNISCAIFGGTAPTVATALIAGTGSPLTPALIVLVPGVIALIATLTLRETAGRRLDAQAQDPISVDETRRPVPAAA